MKTVQFNNTAAELFMKTNLLQAPVFYTLLLPALAYLGVQYTMLKTANSLPAPHQCWLFTLNTLFQVCSFIDTIRDLIVNSFFTAKMTAIISISAVITVTLNTVTIFTIGVAVAQLIIELEKKGEMLDCKSVEQHCSSTLRQISALKKGLSPLLFLVFTSNGIVAIISAYLLVNLPENTPYIYLFLKLVPPILMLIYTCLVLDNCEQTFRALPLEFRY